MALGASNENRLAEEARNAALETAAAVQQHAESFPHSNLNVRPESAPESLPPVSWGEDWLFVGLVGVGLLGLAYVVLRKD
jgi:hypothetical protein